MERSPSAVRVVEVVPVKGMPPDVATVEIENVEFPTAEIAMSRELLCEIANVEIAPVQEMSDSVHVVSPPMASVSCGLRDLTDVYSEVAKIAMVRETLCEIANVNIATPCERCCVIVYMWWMDPWQVCHVVWDTSPRRTEMLQGLQPFTVVLQGLQLCFLLLWLWWCLSFFLHMWLSDAMLMLAA